MNNFGFIFLYVNDEFELNEDLTNVEIKERLFELMNDKTDTLNLRAFFNRVQLINFGKNDEILFNESNEINTNEIKTESKKTYYLLTSLVMIGITISYFYFTNKKDKEQEKPSGRPSIDPNTDIRKSIKDKNMKRESTLGNKKRESSVHINNRRPSNPNIENDNRRPSNPNIENKIKEEENKKIKEKEEVNEIKIKHQNEQ